MEAKLLFEINSQMVGATGIEPVTPTMSRYRPAKKCLQHNDLRNSLAALIRLCSPLVHGFLVQRTREHYLAGALS